MPGSLELLTETAGRSMEAPLAALQASLLSARQAADRVPESLNGQISSLGEQLGGIPITAHEQIKILKEDITNLDHILDTFIVLLQGKVELIR